MNKFFYLVLICFIALTATAQKASEKDLQGRWKMISIAADDVTIDLVTEKATLTPEMEKNMTAAQKEQFDLEMGLGIQMLKESYATFEGTTFNQFMGPENQKGTLSTKDGNSVVTINDKGEVIDLIATIIDKKLHLNLSTPTEKVHLIYVKQ